MATKIDMRSDTVTLPTQEMLQAILSAELGDDVKKEDRTTIELEELAAGMLGKEAGLLVTSGTMGNLVSILTHTQSGCCEMIAESMSHILVSEVGNYARIASVAVRSVRGHNGTMNAMDVEELIRDTSNIHNPRTALICLENSHNYSGGTVASLDNMLSIRRVADKYGVPMHLDGARIFNASEALGIPVSSVSAPFDSVQLCLSKGLSAPIGSVIVGSRAFIDEARHFRKMIGGGMRQCGIIAAAGLVALRTMPQRLSEDHATAKLLAEGLDHVDGIQVDLSTVQTNMVRINTKGLGVTGAGFVEALAAHDLLCGAQGKYVVRFVTHRHITRDSVTAALHIVERVVSAHRQLWIKGESSESL